MVTDGVQGTVPYRRAFLKNITRLLVSQRRVDVGDTGATVVLVKLGEGEADLLLTFPNAREWGGVQKPFLAVMAAAVEDLTGAKLRVDTPHPTQDPPLASLANLTGTHRPPHPRERRLYDTRTCKCKPRGTPRHQSKQPAAHLAQRVPFSAVPDAGANAMGGARSPSYARQPKEFPSSGYTPGSGAFAPSTTPLRPAAGAQSVTPLEALAVRMYSQHASHEHEVATLKQQLAARAQPDPTAAAAAPDLASHAEFAALKQQVKRLASAARSESEARHAPSEVQLREEVSTLRTLLRQEDGDPAAAARQRGTQEQQQQQQQEEIAQLRQEVAFWEDASNRLRAERDQAYAAGKAEGLATAAAAGEGSPGAGPPAELKEVRQTVADKLQEQAGLIRTLQAQLATERSGGRHTPHRPKATRSTSISPPAAPNDPCRHPQSAAPPTRPYRLSPDSAGEDTFFDQPYPVKRSGAAAGERPPATAETVECGCDPVPELAALAIKEIETVYESNRERRSLLRRRDAEVQAQPATTDESTSWLEDRPAFTRDASIAALPGGDGEIRRKTGHVRDVAVTADVVRATKGTSTWHTTVGPVATECVQTNTCYTSDKCVATDFAFNLPEAPRVHTLPLNARRTSFTDPAAPHFTNPSLSVSSVSALPSMPPPVGVYALPAGLHGPGTPPVASHQRQASESAASSDLDNMLKECCDLLDKTRAMSVGEASKGAAGDQSSYWYPLIDGALVTFSRAGAAARGYSPGSEIILAGERYTVVGTRGNNLYGHRESDVGAVSIQHLL
ncbi:hypothetical protein DIPPA_19614 [Diplonema papillatum]|nr:hypothetical protein DIPPA_19614 [Diplonema papillatum]